MKFEIGEINIFCTNIKRSLEFYCDILGFTQQSEEGGAFHLECSSKKVLLLPFTKKPSSSLPYGSCATVSFDLYTDNIDEAFSYFQSNGVKFEREPEKPGDYFFIRDPDDNVIEVVPY